MSDNMFVPLFLKIIVRQTELLEQNDVSSDLWPLITNDSGNYYQQTNSSCTPLHTPDNSHQAFQSMDTLMDEEKVSLSF